MASKGVGGREASGAGLPKGGMERGLEAESTSFSRYNRREVQGTKRGGKRNKGRLRREAETRERGRRAGEKDGVARKRRAGYEISYACLSVRLKLRAQPAAANLEEELGRETNISAEKRRRERKRIVRIVG